MPQFGLTKEECAILRSLNSPKKIQNFLETLPINFEPEGDTCFSPRTVLKERRAHCIEAAMLAALALRLQGERPLVIDLEAAPHDFSHVIALFKRHGHWGAISKSNHVVLRYREPVYKTIRELVLSYFHEYVDLEGRKTLRSFTRPIDLSRFDRHNWMTNDEHVWFVPEFLSETKHKPILNRAQLSGLRKADPIELRSGELTQWKK